MEDLSRMLFRGISLDTQKWIEGYGVIVMPETKESFIIHRQGQNLHQHTEVIPETVGQFTGLTDKNGTKIFEGDILTNNSHNDIIAGFYNGCFINNNTYITLHTEIKDPISRKIVFEITSNIHDKPTP